MNTQRMVPSSSLAPAAPAAPVAVIPAELFSPWRLTDRLSVFHFQDGMTVTRWRSERISAADAPADPDPGLILIETVAATQAILHDQAFTAWREAALWRRLYPHETFAEVLDLLAVADQFAVVQRLPHSARPMLLPAQPDGFRPPDPALGRALPERTAIVMLRKLLEAVEFLLAKSRTLGPAPSPAALLDGVYFVPDLSTPRIKLATAYAGLASTPDQHGRRHLGPLLATFGRLLLTGQYDGPVGGGVSIGAAVKQIRPQLTTQLPAWIDALQTFDGGAGGTPKFVDQFDKYIAQIKTDVVSEIYRPLA
ncbi:MAG TPA: hypothetical protein VL860_11945 [Planctomycetota bacterium]|nr:hypothetical protein [Planctomycetota bacterium]